MLENMNNEIKNLFSGFVLISISLLLYIFRNKWTKVPPNKDKRYYFTEEQSKNKIFIVVLGFTLMGIIIIIFSIRQLLNN